MTNKQKVLLCQIKQIDFKLQKRSINGFIKNLNCWPIPVNGIVGYSACQFRAQRHTMGGRASVRFYCSSQLKVQWGTVNVQKMLVIFWELLLDFEFNIPTLLSLASLSLSLKIPLTIIIFQLWCTLYIQTFVVSSARHRKKAEFFFYFSTFLVFFCHATIQKL